jgi:transcriptional regulator with XRE-family HTH domain
MSQQSITRAQSVGRQVRAVLAEYDMQQSELAKALGMTGNAISRRITGKLCFRADELMAIAEHLGVDPARFFRPVPEPRARDEPKAARATTTAGAAA